ncbi:Interleukin-12 receptor subunit beta-2 [Frankliniella fusca]|uniref:Interleukin-12 receptor subunit beta-2 n=1 Tax=Frankliniella fusca TaxID=407009 RepID=A0AAE1H910_9NEOP|nr:Interleukin-12 receptor subunit beta-2 [Frankliniella fusca]
MSERADLIASNPLIADSYFYLRSKFFIDHCFKPHFGVTDIWYRYEWEWLASATDHKRYGACDLRPYEFQHRGSVHLHGLAWFDKAPKLKKEMTEEDKDMMLKFFDSIVSFENPDVSLLPSQQHPCQITLENVTNLKEDLAQLCNNVQRHTKCRKGFCLKEHKAKKHLVCKYPRNYFYVGHIQVNLYAIHVCRLHFGLVCGMYVTYKCTCMCAHTCEGLHICDLCPIYKAPCVAADR